MEYSVSFRLVEGKLAWLRLGLLLSLPTRFAEPTSADVKSTNPNFHLFAYEHLRITMALMVLEWKE